MAPGSRSGWRAGAWEDRAELGRAYLDAGAMPSAGPRARGGRPRRVRGAGGGGGAAGARGRRPGARLLEGSADVGFIGGFAAAVAALGGGRPGGARHHRPGPAARPVAGGGGDAGGARRGRLNPRFIAGQLRHGPRGAAELAETVDRLVGFAETTDAVPEALIEAVYAAYVGDPAVRAFLLRENPAAAQAVAERLAAARRRGLWHPRRNAVDDELAALLAEARAGGGGMRAPLRRGACPTLARADADRRRLAGAVAGGGLTRGAARRAGGGGGAARQRA